VIVAVKRFPFKLTGSGKPQAAAIHNPARHGVEEKMGEQRQPRRDRLYQKDLRVSAAGLWNGQARSPAKDMLCGWGGVLGPTPTGGNQMAREHCRGRLRMTGYARAVISAGHDTMGGEKSWLAGTGLVWPWAWAWPHPCRPQRSLKNAERAMTIVKLAHLRLALRPCSIYNT